MKKIAITSERSYEVEIGRSYLEALIEMAQCCWASVECQLRVAAATFELLAASAVARRIAADLVGSPARRSWNRRLSQRSFAPIDKETENRQ